MGSGKSTVGKKVARLLDRPFVDADVALVEQTGRTVAEWFADGEPAFRRAEAGLLATLLGADEPTVIAAGGGVVVADENRKRLSEPSVTVVLLDAEPAFLASRAKAKPHRPLLADDPLAVLTRLHAERDGWYREVADVVVAVRPAHEAGERPKWNLAEQIVTALAERGEAPSLDTVIARKPTASASDSTSAGPSERPAEGTTKRTAKGTARRPDEPTMGTAEGTAEGTAGGTRA